MRARQSAAPLLGGARPFSPDAGGAVPPPRRSLPARLRGPERSAAPLRARARRAHQAAAGAFRVSRERRDVGSLRATASAGAGDARLLRVGWATTAGAG